MERSRTRTILAGGIAAAVALAACRLSKHHDADGAAPGQPGAITIDYPADGSIFPPEFPAPTWQWRDSRRRRGVLADPDLLRRWLSADRGRVARGAAAHR